MRAVKTGREFDRYLTVRGLSEREMKEDHPLELERLKQEDAGADSHSKPQSPPHPETGHSSDSPEI